MLSVQGISLRPHQAEAVDAVVEGLSLSSPLSYSSCPAFPADGSVAARGRRGQVRMATGTGKTVMAAVAALRLVPRGLVGVLVPTLELLTQTAEAWRAVGHDGPAVAVCGLGSDPLLEALDVRCTTNPTQLALWAGSGPMLVFATYASLSPQGLADDQGDRGEGDGVAAPGVLERALLGSYGQRMGAFDLLVVDEAHRTSGDLGKAWAAVHDQRRIPAGRRLYMTATPRLWEASPGGGTAADVRSGGLVASMDDEELYGPVLYEFGLMESVERGVLARFEIDVLEIRDPAPPGPDTSLEERRGRRLAALQASLLKHADTTGMRSFMTFHSRTLDAMAFARGLPETSAELHAVDPVAYPKRIGADWLCGEHPAAHRRAVLSRFADGLDAEGWVTDLSFLSSCRVLGEGVDIRGERGVAGVVFADTRSSPVEIVQIAGRGLRQEPGEGKVSRLIIPVFLRPGEDPDRMIASPSYRPLVAVLQGLRAHDERLVERMALRTTTARGKALSVVGLDPVQEDGTDDDAVSGTSDAGTADNASTSTSSDADVPLLRFSQPHDPGVIAAFLRTRVLQPDSEVWLTGYNALYAWAQEHGDVRVPAGTVVPLDGGEGALPLGSWVSEQRRAFRLGALKPWRAELLDELGMIWSVADAAFSKKLASARAYHAKHATLAAPKDAVTDGVAVGQWLANLRRPGGLGRNEERAAHRREALKAIDPDWNPPWPVDWQRHYAAARLLLTEKHGPTEILPGVTVHGIDVGTWVHRQRDPSVWQSLMPEQRERLERLGLHPLVEPEQPAATRTGSFERGLRALAQYAAREGHHRVPRAHTEEITVEDEPGPVKVRLGVWISNTRSRRDRLAERQRAALSELGVDWT